MVLKVDRPKTRSLGKSMVTEAMLREMVRKGYLAEGAAQLSRDDEVLTRPDKDEVVVFCDLFQAGVCFPLDQVLLIFYKPSTYICIN